MNEIQTKDWPKAVGLEAFRLGILNLQEQVVLNGPPVSRAELSSVGQKISDLLSLSVSLLNRIYNGDRIKMAQELGFQNQQAEVLAIFSEEIVETTIARADLIRVQNQWKLLELNVGSAVGGISIASLPRLAGFEQHWDVLKEWAELTARSWRINSKIAFVEDRRYVEKIRKSLRVMTSEMEKVIGAEVPIYAHDELSYKDGKLVGPRGEIQHIYRFFTEKDVLQAWDSYGPIINAARAKAVSFPMGPAYRLLSNKGILALLWQLAEDGILSNEERLLVTNLIPKTVWVHSNHRENIIKNQLHLVLKPTDGGAGEGVYCGKELTKEEWCRMIDAIITANNYHSHVVQEFCNPEIANVFLMNSTGDISEQRCQILWGAYVFGAKFLGAQQRTKTEFGSHVINQATGASIGPLRPLE